MGQSDEFERPSNNDRVGVALSFIIPAYNEAENIGRTLRSVSKALEGGLSYELIVVDHGSSDETTIIARRAGAKVIQPDARTIGELRNRGAERAEGGILVFLDADVTLTSTWAAQIESVVSELSASPNAVIGGRCEIPEDASWIERVWFGPLRDSGKYVGSAHMLVNRQFFWEVDGFAPFLRTGEDYEFCARTRRQGGHVRLCRGLRAIHHGFPRTLAQFLRREMWHGAGDVQSFGTFVRSKVAVASTVFALLHVLVFAGILLSHSMMTVIGLSGLTVLLMVSVGRRFGVGRQLFSFRVILLQYLYFLGRALAIMRSCLATGVESRRVRGGA